MQLCTLQSVLYFDLFTIICWQKQRDCDQLSFAYGFAKLDKEFVCHYKAMQCNKQKYAAKIKVGDIFCQSFVYAIKKEMWHYNVTLNFKLESKYSKPQ